jgi:NAD(P)H-dependent FMN reductase
MTVKIAGIAGSLRRESFNPRLTWSAALTQYSATRRNSATEDTTCTQSSGVTPTTPQ